MSDRPLKFDRSKCFFEPKTFAVQLIKDDRVVIPMDTEVSQAPSGRLSEERSLVFPDI